MMSDLSRHNPVGRFEGLASLYARHRPSYPASAIDFILEQCRLGTDTPLVDVGCGTGISSRLCAARGVPVIGVEPNDEMRREAEAASPAGGTLRYQKGSAEATGLPDGLAAAVLSAQAFHWFDAPRALAEFHRVLRPGGHVALIWNERDESDPFTAAYGAVVRSSPDAAIMESARAEAGMALLRSEWFTDGARTQFSNTQELDEEGLVGRAFSVSYAPREPAAAEKFATKLRRAFAAFQRDGKVLMRYVTTVYLAARN